MAAEMASEAAASSGGGRRRAARSFKLRFAAQREPGRSDVSAVKPLGLPATVAGKFYAREEESRDAAEAELAALRRVRELFSLGPRERHEAPVLTSHEYGWWQPTPGEQRVRGGLARLRWPLRDSPWLRERLRVLAADAALRPH